MELGDYREVAWRVDSHPAVYQKWQNSDSAGANAYDSTALELATAIQNAQNSLLIKSGRKTHRFSVRNSTETISKLIQKCGI